jgi:hypothetical protein
LIHLDGTSLPDEVDQQCDVMTLSGQLEEALERQGLGEYDGDGQGPAETTLFMYGSDAERLFSGIEAVLRAYPLCQNARVVSRRGPPGAAERELLLPRV